MRRTLSTLVATLALAGGGLLATAGAASADPCGQWYTKNSAYYNHCGSGPVVVYVRYLQKDNDSTSTALKTECLAPGNHLLGANADNNMVAGAIQSSRSDGDPC